MKMKNICFRHYQRVPVWLDAGGYVCLLSQWARWKILRALQEYCTLKGHNSDVFSNFLQSVIKLQSCAHF